MKTIDQWIRPFLKRYAATIGPHDFPDGSDPEEVRCFVEGWVGAFSIPYPKITEEEADAARTRLALNPPAFRRDHCPAVVAVVLGMRQRDAASRLAVASEPSGPEAVARAESRGCPECSDGGTPTGWATRRAMWVTPPQWSASLRLFCRCPLGRFLRDAHQLPRPMYDDLQARPDLWDPDMAHETWSDEPEDEAAGYKGEWRYLAVGEPGPEPLTSPRRLREIAAESRPASPRPRDEGMGREPYRAAGFVPPGEVREPEVIEPEEQPVEAESAAEDEGYGF
jgi:hypothetical protein